MIPRLYIFLILVLSGIILRQIFRGKEKVVPKIERTGLLVLTMAILIVYFLAMPFIGYFLSTFLFIVLMLHMLSYRKKMLIYVIAGGWVLLPTSCSISFFISSFLLASLKAFSESPERREGWQTDGSQ